MSQGDLFTGRFTARPKRQRKAPITLLPLVERIANQERVAAELTACAAFCDERQARAYRAAAENARRFGEALRAGGAA